MKLFICDYTGTFTGGEDRENELKKFFALLDQLAGDEQMMFSFASTNMLKDLETSLIEADKYRSSKIIMGPQHAGDAYLDEKRNVIVRDAPYKVNNIKDLLNKYQSFLTTVYYAEDALILQKTLHRLIGQFPVDYVAFMPGGNISEAYCSSQKGLPGLNEAIQNHLDLQLEHKKLS